MNLRRQPHHLFGAWAGLLALGLQALLPLLLAVEIRAAAAHDAALPDSLCLSDAAAPTGPAAPAPGKPHDHGMAGSCPICTALSAALDLAAPGVPHPSCPWVQRTVLAPERSARAGFSLHLASYEARGPPGLV